MKLKKMGRQILDPIDFFHTMYDVEADERAAKLESQESEQISSLLAFDEDNFFSKLGDFWPKGKPPLAA